MLFVDNYGCCFFHLCMYYVCINPVYYLNACYCSFLSIFSKRILLLLHRGHYLPTPLCHCENWTHTKRIKTALLQSAGLTSLGCKFECPQWCLSNNNLKQVVYTLCASVTKHYKLLPGRGQWCSVAGKVSVGPAIELAACHWIYD